MTYSDVIPDDRRRLNPIYLSATLNDEQDTLVSLRLSMQADLLNRECRAVVETELALNALTS